MKSRNQVSKLPAWAQSYIRNLEQKLADKCETLKGLTAEPLDCARSDLPAGVYLVDMNERGLVYRLMPGRTVVVSSGEFQVQFQWDPEEKRSVGAYSSDAMDVRPEVSNSVRLVRRERR